MKLFWMDGCTDKPKQICFPLFFQSCWHKKRAQLLEIQRYDVQGKCADPGSFVRGGPTLTTFFLLLFVFSWWGSEDSNTTISGSSLARQRKPFKWCLVALWFSRGCGSVLLRNPIFLWFFSGGPDPPPLWNLSLDPTPSLEPPMGYKQIKDKYIVFLMS